MRNTQPVQSETIDQGARGSIVRESHPAFGVATVTRAIGSNRALFQSDVEHHHTITLSIHRATRDRELNRDRVHPREELIEIEMSLAQWGSLVSSIGLGSGVPITIRATETDRMVDGLPYQPRLAENLDEVAATVEKTLAGVREKLDALTEAIEQKQGVKAIRQALDSLNAAVNNAPANSKYAVTSLQEAAERVVSQARADIEAHVLSAAQATGIEASVAVPTFALED